LEPIELEPRYSTKEMPGKCLRCAAKHELEILFRELLRKYERRDKDKELEGRFETLVAFLKSPGLGRLINESEKCLAEGREVKLIIHTNETQPKYELIAR